MQKPGEVEQISTKKRGGLGGAAKTEFTIMTNLGTDATLRPIKRTIHGIALISDRRRRNGPRRWGPRVSDQRVGDPPRSATLTS